MESAPLRCIFIANCKTSEIRSIFDRLCPAAHARQRRDIPVPNDPSLRCTNVWKQKALKSNSSSMAEKRQWSAGRRTKAVGEGNQTRVVRNKVKEIFQQTPNGLF